MNCENVLNTMVDETVKYFYENNIQAAILGVSGGIDSTIVAYIFSKVNRKLLTEYDRYVPLIGISMPTETTNPEEFAISELVGRSLCNEFKVIDITNEANAIVVPHVETSNSYSDKVRLGNVKARLRMIHLYDLAKAYKGIVLGTDNYTEYLLGYSTIGGDSLFDFCPIQYLWKTEIYELAQYALEKEIENKAWDKVHALNESIKIAPQAGLGITSTDLEEIGAPSYAVIDTILQCALTDTKVPEHYDSSVIMNVLNRYRGSEYKRNHPVVIKREKFNI
jgi:NAD+ synthetase